MSGALAALFIYNKVCFLRPNFISLVVQIVLTNTTLICVGVYSTYFRHNFGGRSQFYLTRKCFEFRQFWIKGDIQTICEGVSFQSLISERYSENNYAEYFDLAKASRKCVVYSLWKPFRKRNNGITSFRCFIKDFFLVLQKTVSTTFNQMLTHQSRADTFHDKSNEFLRYAILFLNTFLKSKSEYQFN